MPLFLVTVIVHYAIKRNKKFLNYVKADYKKLGFDLIEERPFPLAPREFEVSVKPMITINGLPVSRYGYMRKFARVFKAKDQEGQLFDLYSVITKQWDGENEIEIKDKELLLSNG